MRKSRREKQSTRESNGEGETMEKGKPCNLNVKGIWRKEGSKGV